MPLALRFGCFTLRRYLLNPVVPPNRTIADFLGGAELDSFQQLFIAAREPLLAQARLLVDHPMEFC